jgi:serine/threonine protein kinase/formylglycine-generating enzyme required for sulfatase activity/predicted esterase
VAAREEHPPARYCFDDVVVEPRNFRVLKNGESRSLEPRVFDLLIFLIENRGRVVEKQELFEQVWKQAFVTDNALTRAIKEIRRVIGDDASAPRYIETIPKRGYRFVAEVLTSSSQPSRTRRPEDLVSALNYKIQSKLGQGGGGVVYLAEDTRLKRTVVLKFLSEELTSNEVGLKRFLREARLASSLDHPNICTIYEVNQVDGLDFIVMQYAEGKTLKQLISGKPLRIDSTISIAIQIANALAAAHDQAIIHRDVKPGNIIVTSKGQVKILDFGLAKSLAYAERTGDGDESELTRHGAQLGTPAYMSPEQARGEEADHRSDIFSFGIVLFEMATGRVPFKCRSQAETMNAVINTPHTPIAELNSQMPPELSALIDRALAKEPNDRYQTMREVVSDLLHLSAQSGGLNSSFGALDRGSTPYIPLKLAHSAPSARRRIALALAVTAIVAGVATLFYLRGANLRWAREQVPRINQLAQEQKYFDGYDLALKASRYLPDDPTIARLMPVLSDNITVTTEPAGARVYLKRFSQDGAGKFPPRELIGSTPITNLRVARGEYIVYIEKDGYAPFERTISSKLYHFATTMLPPDEPTVVNQRLIEVEKLPDRMAFVPGGAYRLVCWQAPTTASIELADYFIDKYEVTNREYKEFINAGGYQKKAYWKHPFSQDTRVLSWEEAMSEFRDRTGLAAPRSWSGQNFPEGKAEHPVTDITWYEAAAYAEFRAKQLPTIFQWEKAARNGLFTYYSGYVMPWGPIDVTSTVDTRANFKSGGTTPVGSLEFGMSPFGAYDMAGNVAEWCANQTTEGFITAGASWDDLSYMFAYVGDFPGFSNSGKLGFRCVLNQHVTGDQGAMRIDAAHQIPVYAPTTEAAFRALLSHYRYDKLPLDGQVIEVRDTDAWRREKITYIGANDERALAYLYLPKNVSKPYQVLQFVPAGDVYGGYMTMPEAAEMLLAPFIRSGRAVFAVVFKHFKERDRPPDYQSPRSSSVKRREELVNDATDLRRGLDYLQTRDDIDSSRIAYFGFSQGASEGVIFTAVEERYRSVVLVAVGIGKPGDDWLPEVSASNFASHIRAPKLLLNGRYDEVNTLKMRVEPLYKLLREPKKLVLYDGSHTPPIEITVPAVNSFLDETLGKTKFD